MYFIYWFDCYSWKNYIHGIKIFCYIFMYFMYLLIYLYKLSTNIDPFNYFFLKKLNICDCCEGSQAHLIYIKVPTLRQFWRVADIELRLLGTVAIAFATVGTTVLWTVAKDSCDPNIRVCWGTVANVHLWPF